MDIQTFSELWDDLSESRRKEGLQKIFSHMIENIDTFDNVFYMEILPILIDLESDDFFGTEGADI
ncbi:hypothetical protein SmphiM6_45 [Sinorhizobium phage phiM6]|nr:hypothetical protein SmphiM6_45 [Sinorhizobium phage phiM6]